MRVGKYRQKEVAMDVTKVMKLRYQTFQSVTAIMKPVLPFSLFSSRLAPLECLGLGALTASSAILLRASLCSAGVSQHMVSFSGEPGRMNNATTATSTVKPPSIKYNQRHAVYPRTPSMAYRMKEPIREPKALLMKLPQAKYAPRRESSLCLYHFAFIASTLG